MKQHAFYSVPIALAALGNVTAAAQATKPNIVLIMTDQQ
jgi:hypothetical protein